VLPQGNRAMPQLFWSVFTTVLLHFLFQFLYEYHVDFSTLPSHERTPQANWPWNYFRRIPTYVIQSINVNHRWTTSQDRALHCIM